MKYLDPLADRPYDQRLDRGADDQINIGILQTTVSGILQSKPVPWGHNLEPVFTGIGRGPCFEPHL